MSGVYGTGSRRWQDRPGIRLALQIAFIFGIANFAIFFVVSLLIGGDAWNGHVVDGRYFLRSHGQLTEVNAAVFSYSRWHVISLFVTHPLGMIAAAVLAGFRKP